MEDLVLKTGKNYFNSLEVVNNYGDLFLGIIFCHKQFQAIINNIEEILASDELLVKNKLL